MILAPRLDDLASVYPAFRALRSCGTPRGIAMAAVFHHEEIGSMSQQGADSTFLAEVIDRIARTMHFDRDIALAHSYMLSADNAHGTHPITARKAIPPMMFPLTAASWSSTTPIMLLTAYPRRYVMPFVGRREFLP